MKQFLRGLASFLPSREPQDGHIIVLREQRAIYFAVPKAANSSVKAVCSKLLKLDAAGGRAGLFNGANQLALRQQGIMISKRDVAGYPGYFRFTFVRNPWDRLVSCYSQKIRDSDYVHPDFTAGVASTFYRDGFRSSMSFDEFARRVAKTPDRRADKHFRSQHKLLTGDNGELLVDFVGKFESLAEDFATVADRIGIEDRLPHMLKSKRGTYRDYYSDELWDLVGRRYARDIDLFGYESAR